MAGVDRDELVRYVDALLDAPAFDDYCPNGLQVEGRATVRRIVGGVTASQALLDAAVAAGADLVLVHHGLFWRGDDPRVVGYRRRRLATLLAADVNLLAYHLPLDAHPEVGNNAGLAALLGLVPDGRFGRGGRDTLAWIGRCDPPLVAQAFADRLAERLGRQPLHVPGTASMIRRVGWCTGAAQSYIEAAVLQGVDAFVTGEASEATVHVARETGVHFFAAGHHATERSGVQALGARIAAHFGIGFEFIDIDNPV